jgi:uncharacterized membrane protein SpoIIM required for sporulation
MKETTFIKQNKKKWARFEKLSGRTESDPDEVARLFTEITEDLSYARTFYPRRSVRVYLNQLAQGVFTSLYKHERKPLGSFVKFWTVSLPLELYRARVNLLVAFLFFMLAAVVGAVSQHYDSSFAEMVLGPYYIEHTEELIRDGNPMGIYGESSQTSMFLQITVNNIRVAFLAFVAGTFLSIGTFLLLLQNGVMLGSFQWWFKMKGLLLTSFLAIWIHGAFEISAIIIAGGAGLTLGNSILFPGSFSRVQSMIFGAKRGLRIMMSLIPIFIMAGFLESYVTRHYNVMPSWTKWTIILVSFALIIGYYVIYPFIVARRYPERIEVKEVPRFIPDRKIIWSKIRKVGEVFTDTFYVIVKNFFAISKGLSVSVLPILIVLIAMIFTFDFYSFNSNLGMGSLWERSLGMVEYFDWYKFIGWSIIVGLLFTNVFYYSSNDKDETPIDLDYWKYVLSRGVWMSMFGVLFMALVNFVFWYYNYLVSDLHFYEAGGIQFIFCFLIFYAGVVIISPIPTLIAIEKKNFFAAMAGVFDIGQKFFSAAFGSVAVFILLSLIFLGIINSPLDAGFDLASLAKQIVELFTTTVTPYYLVITNILLVLLYLLYFFTMLIILAVSWRFIYYSSNETKSAAGLYERLERFGKRNKTFETKEDYE